MTGILPAVVDVSGGIVSLTGPSDPLNRRAMTLLARSIPGVLEVVFTASRQMSRGPDST